MADNSNEIQRLYDISANLDSNIANLSAEPAKVLSQEIPNRTNHTEDIKR
jgi:hypothetical protein